MAILEKNTSRKRLNAKTAAKVKTLQPLAQSTAAKPMKNASKAPFQMDYAPAPESAKVVKLKEKYDLFIDGKFRAPSSGKYFSTLNPATGKELAKVAEANDADVDLAVAAARRAFDTVWSKLSGKERGRYLFRIARILAERAREFAVLETMDNGKPIKESRDVDIPLASAHFFYYAGWADKLEYLSPGKNPSALGVVGQVIPWNFPLLMAAWKIAPALAAGNTVVLKPAETTPLTALLLAEVLVEAGLPDGVVNILTGAGATGAAIVSHPGVAKVAFTGSTEVGRKIAESCAETGKKLTLELGGKSAHIIFADAAIDQAVEGIVNGIFFNQGQVCCAGSRLLVEESVADLVIAKLKRRMESLRVGDPMDKNTDIGAINSREQLDKIQQLVAIGEAEGGERFSPARGELPKAGFFFKPTIFTNLASSATLCRVEVFGPVLTIQTFRTVNEAVAKANDTPYGLAAGIWSEKGSKVHQVAAKLKAGVIWANTYNKFDPSSPFGGYGESGWGREGGRHGLIPYLNF